MAILQFDDCSMTVTGGYIAFVVYRVLLRRDCLGFLSQQPIDCAAHMQPR
jgi:hypothetical protein